MVSSRRLLAALPLAVVFVLACATVAVAAGQPPVNLGTSATYGVLAYESIANTGTTYVTGDLGVEQDNMPGPGIVVTGATHLWDAAAHAAVADLKIAYADAASRKPATIITGDLGGRTLLPGVYAPGPTAGDLTLTGTLVLDAQGDPDAVWVFQVPDGNLNIQPGAVVLLVNGARFCRVFWQVDFNTNIGANASFQGHVLGRNNIAAASGATVKGQLMAMGWDGGGNISLDRNRIDNSICTTWTPRLPKTGYAPGESNGSPWLPVAGSLAGVILLAAGAVHRRSGATE